MMVSVPASQCSHTLQLSSLHLLGHAHAWIMAQKDMFARFTICALLYMPMNMWKEKRLACKSQASCVLPWCGLSMEIH